MSSSDRSRVVDVDIVSDVVCPWCVIGFLQLSRALSPGGPGIRVRWHPFELNPRMPAEGQDLGTHMEQKYATTPEQNATTRDRITAIGAALGFRFRFENRSRIVNTFRAHQLLDWAALQGRQHDLKMALFAAYFSDGRDVSDQDVLLDVVGSVGLDCEDARGALDLAAHARNVREMENMWVENGVRSVPTMIFAGRIVQIGVQEPATYARSLAAALESPAA